MYKIVQLPKQEFNTYLLNTAAKKNLNVAIVEKDFWVCLTLDYLFQYSKWKDAFAFKGGTCLSKVYHAIERFSEDIDLILDWRILGYTIDEPWQKRSNTKQLQFIEESRQRLYRFLKTEFLDDFMQGMKNLTGISINAYIDPNDPGTVIFAYPSMHSDPSILNVIKLEIGILASWMPLTSGFVASFVAEVYPTLFAVSKTRVNVTTIERTFWEKATILHQEAFRPVDSKVPLRYSRHYYDLFCLCKKGIDKYALNDSNLLNEVSEFKMKFYPRRWARYDLAKFGSIHLLPPQHSIEQLEKDYLAMQKMIYGERPSFKEILQVIGELEKQINR